MVHNDMELKEGHYYKYTSLVGGIGDDEVMYYKVLMITRTSYIILNKKGRTELTRSISPVLIVNSVEVPKLIGILQVGQ